MDESELESLNRKIGEAELMRDAAFLGEILAGELVFRRAGGKVVTKEEYLADLIKPENTYEYLESNNIQAIADEETALVTLFVKAKGKRGETEFAGEFENLRVFVRRAAKWQCIVWFNRKIS
jgi:hypothetical protein